MRRRWGLAMPALALGFLLSSAAFAAGMTIPAGARLPLNGGTLDAAGGSLRIDGTLELGSGVLRGLDALRIAVGGSADFGSGTATVTGDWENRGTFAAGSSRVELRDGAAVQSAILGASQFATLSLVSAGGKRYHFESGLTQRVSALLQVLGNGLPIQLDVTTAGSAAFLDLAPTGTQVIANVGVSDVHAAGQHLAPTLTNQGGRGNAAGWFGGVVPAVPPVPVPALSWSALLALIAAFLFVATRRTARPRAARGK